MNWEAIGAFGEVLGAIAVVVTLIFLTVQVRQNSKLLRATIREQRTESSHRIQLHMAAEAQDDELSRGIVMNAMFRDWDTYARQYSDGLIDEAEWASQLKIWKVLLSQPEVLGYWKVFGEGYSTQLQEAIDLIQAEVVNVAGKDSKNDA